MGKQGGGGAPAGPSQQELDQQRSEFDRRMALLEQQSQGQQGLLSQQFAAQQAAQAEQAAAADRANRATSDQARAQKVNDMANAESMAAGNAAQAQQQGFLSRLQTRQSATQMAETNRAQGQQQEAVSSLMSTLLKNRKSRGLV